MRRVWRRVVAAWKTLWGKPVSGLDHLLKSPAAASLRMAVEKGRLDEQWASVATPSAKRLEALRWARLYAADLFGTTLGEWEANFLLEYYVGKEKGRL